MTDEPLAPGLYLVSTPIGNLEDITLRALRVLRSVDRIACEDTRQTRKLLDRYTIATPTLSSHEHNEAARSRQLIEELRAGARIAVVSDAGTPGISDPGMVLAAAAVAAGIAVYPVPGPSALLAGLVASGLNTDNFLFVGFLPSKAGARRTALENLAASIPPTTTIVFYEAPHRIAETLAEIENLWGADCRIVLARELTKIHEEFLRGSVGDVRSQVVGRDSLRGEIVLLVEAPPADAIRPLPSANLLSRLDELEKSENLSAKDALKRIARERGISKSELWRELQRERARGK
ncbi:MAG TPA: 16S rRNA (cytidine(1402)-2'-O)-methyltransferase [Acidobacteriaceae bacterium]|nr:16S rRNA (cytidine(1402)-2'-O)-methyltransferase [Acidobacteriaceae bacterium]